MRRRLLFPVAAMVAIGLLAAAAPASALPAGSLDPTFGWGGISVADFGDGYPECTWDHSLPICRGGEENAADVFGLADGSVLVQLAPGGDVVRFRADGQLDTTFGNGGRTSIGVGNGHLRVDGHGFIYVPWRPSPGTAPGSSAITRLRPNGTIDTTFGVGGTVLHAEDQRWTVDPTGRVYLYRTGIEPDDARSVRVSRLDVVGAPDAGYGPDGTATLLVPHATPDGWVVEPDPVVEIGATDEIVVLHRASTPAGWSVLRRVVLGRLDPDGEPDLAFSPTGGVRFPTGPAWFPSLFQFDARHLALLPDGRILVAGIRPVPDGAAVSVVRLGATGDLDPTYAFGGISIVDLTTAPYASGQSYEALRWLGTDAFGRALVVGQSGLPSSSGERHHVVRLGANGFVDASFGAGGVTTLPTELERGGNAFGAFPSGAVIIGGQARATDRLCGPAPNRVPCADLLLMKLRG